MEILQVEREEETKDGVLEQQYKNLQQFWDSCKQSKPRTKQRCSSTDSYSMDSKTNLYVLNISPRDLMSSLQQRRSPTEGGTWQTRNKDSAIEEIRMDRRAAIENGKLQGRQLFKEKHEVGFGGGEEICSSSWSDYIVQESEVIGSVSSCASDDYGEIDNASDDYGEIDNGGTNDEVNVVECCQSCYYCSSSSSSSSSSLSSENLGGEHAIMEEEKRDVRGASFYRGRWMIFMGWFLIALIVFSVGIVSVKSFDGYWNHNEVILVPT